MSEQLAAVLPDAVKAATKQVKANSRKWAGVFPDDNTKDGYWYAREARDGMTEIGTNHGWTTSFWTGMQWLAHELEPDAELLAAAKAGSFDHVRRAYAEQDTDTHDLGFLYSLSTIADWLITKDELAAQGAIRAAELLMQRYLEPAGIIQAWGDLSDPEQQGRAIIDSLMNLPLLVWAGEKTGDPRYLAAVRRHASQIADRIIREDDSTFHTYHWDPETGEPLRGTTHQGFSDSSCWARGQAWGIYGFAMTYQATGDPKLLDAAYRVTDYFLAHLPKDLVPFWDLIFTDGSTEERDTSAAAIAVCGLKELAEIASAAPETAERGKKYAQAADDILYSLITKYTPAAQGKDSDGLLLESVYNKPHGMGINEATQFGDYFYLEALMRATNPNWVRYW